MILEIFMAFLLFDGMLLADDLAAAEHKSIQAKKKRDRAMDGWLRGQ